jgi:hypothetical protein
MSFAPPPLRKFTKSEIAALEGKFRAADTDHNGGISPQEAGGLWKACGLDKIWLNVAFAMYDENRDGQLQWDEFVKFFETATACQESGTLGDLERQVFDGLALGEGNLTADGVFILRCIRDLFLGTPEKDFTQEQAAAFVKKFGAGGVVTFDQWVRGIKATP